MLDPKFLTENPDFIREAIRRKNSPVDLDELLKIDADWRALSTKVDGLRSRRNEAAKNRDIDAGKKIGAELKDLEPELAELTAAREKLLRSIPNRPDDEAPIGTGEDDNIEAERWGEPREFSFPPRDHVALGEITDTIDLDRARTVSGARFFFLKNELPFLEFALQQWVWRKLFAKKFIPLIPPMLIRAETFHRAGKFPGLADDVKNMPEIFGTKDDDLFLVGTAEHVTLGYHTGDTLDEKNLPLRYAAWSSAFRREAGAAGKDTRGILRVHQFDKLEMLVFTTPEKSREEHKFLIETQKEIWRELGIPFRIIDACGGDMSWSDARMFDLEAWMPGQGKYREVTSGSNCTDFQARRLGTKIAREDGSKVIAHTLNATAISIQRALIAIMENFQNADGSIEIPEVLWPFLPDGMTKIPARNPAKK